ncbi:MAG TPA: Mu-like prophage major head subunit gpT family protein, partial [Vicinamibacterales bacterium]|nr:Mu-like prophage major head subunit gpT family protein [Vicinamibacterales bacterium]
IRLGWSVEDTSQKVLKAMRENRPQADVHFSVNRDGGPNHQKCVLEAALCLRAGIADETLAGQYGERVVEAALRDRDLSLHQLLVECARMDGISVPRSFGNETIRAAFSSVSLPGILNNVANKKLLKSFQSQPVIATKLCSEGELNDFKESERYRLTDVGDLEPVAPDGELKHGGAKEEKATNQLSTFGKIFSLTRQMIYNDDLGAFLKVPEGMGARAARKIDQLFFTRLLANTGSLFSEAHGNYKEGAETALSGDSLALAVQMFMDQTDADGQPINVSPKFLLVPTGLKITARELLNSIMFLAVGATNKQRIPTYNALADEELEVVTSPYLSNANYDGASAKAWYLFADPAIVDTFEIGYLKGRRTPTVEQGDTDFDTLGIKFRVFFDLGVREQDHRGMVKFKGEA